MSNAPPAGSPPASPATDGILPDDPTAALNEDLLETLLGDAAYGVMVTDPDTSILWENKVFAAAMGVPEGKRSLAIGLRAVDLPNIRGTRTERLFRDLMREDGTGPVAAEVSVRSIYGKNSILKVQGHPIRDSSGALLGFLCMAEDVTAQRASEHALGQRTRELQTLSTFANSMSRGDPIELFLERTGPLLSELTGYPRVVISLTAPDHPALVLVHRHNIPDSVADLIREVPVGSGTIGEAAAKRSIVVQRAPTDETFNQVWASMGVVEAIGIPLIERGELLGVIAIARGERAPGAAVHRPSANFLENLASVIAGGVQRARDAASLLQAADRLRRQKQELSLLVEAVSHHLKAPLVSVAGLIGLLQEGPAGQDPRMHSTLGRVRGNVEQLSEILRNVVEFTELGSEIVQLAPVGLSEVVETVLVALEDRVEAANVEVQADGNLPVVRGDRRRLLRMFHEIVDNALRYGRPAAGRPKIRIFWTEGPESSAVTVQDNGDGPGCDDPDHPFRPFWRGLNAAEEEGTGIGLPLAQRIAEAHGWRLEMRRSGHATELTVILPRHRRRFTALADAKRWDAPREEAPGPTGEET